MRKVEQMYKRIRYRISHFFFLLKNTVYAIFIIKSKNYIIVNGTFKWNCGHVINYNWGDDLNYYLFNYITDKQIICYRDLIFYKCHLHKENILAIGSIIENLTNVDSIIWGAGVLYGDCSLTVKPKKVLAVRGPLSRQYLLNQGINCPAIYGDPALLVKYFYHPNVQKKYKYGIIPHYVDLNSEPIIELSSSFSSDVKVINIQKYDNWLSFIDQINECEYILSSSLHGIIISDAYNIPNVWVQFSNQVAGNGFKFYDYFLSVKREIDSPVIIKERLDFKLISEQFKFWKPIDIDLNPLINSCPFAPLREVINKGTKSFSI